MDSIKVICQPDKNNPYAVIYKPKGLPSAPLTEDDRNNAFYRAMELFPQLKEVHGKKEIEHGLLHRLDTATDGLILIAASQDFYDFMICEQSEGRFIKYYTALCDLNMENPKLLEAFPPAVFYNSDKVPYDGMIIESYFRPFGKGGREVRPVTKESGAAALKKIGKAKIYKTEITEIKKFESEGRVEVTCKISQGFRHQVRCHLAWAGLPVVNDRLYNGEFRQSSDGNSDHYSDSEKLCFSATKIEFINPVENKLMCFKIKKYPARDLNSHDKITRT